MERTYKTQMEAARKGIVTPEMKTVAAKEYRTEEEIRNWVAEGKVAICANKNHKCIDPAGVGSMLKTKINVNLGVSRDCKDYNIEMQKVNAAVEMGADASDKPFLWGYYLTDVTNDGVCDLIVDYGTCEADRMCTVYTYLEDELFKYQETGSSHAVMGAYPNQDGFIVMAGHMGVQTITVACKADRESMEFPYFEAGDKDYIKLPYELDGHINYESENAELDLSPLE